MKLKELNEIDGFSHHFANFIPEVSLIRDQVLFNVGAYHLKSDTDITLVSPRDFVPVCRNCVNRTENVLCAAHFS